MNTCNTMLAVAMGLVVACSSAKVSSIHAQTRILDNFNDGDAGDANPLQWVPMPAYPGTYDASNGDYFVESFTANSLVAATVQEPVINNISIRSRLRITEESQPGSSTDNAGLAVRFTGSRPYLVSVTVDGLVLLRDRGQPIFESVPTDLRPLEEDVFLQLDVFDDVLSAWAWRAGDVPDAPLLTAQDSSLSEGEFGVFFNSFPDDPAAATAAGSAVFRWVQISDSHIPISAVCDFSGDSFCDVTDLDLLYSLGPISSGIPATGNESFDLTGDGSIDLADRDLWLAEAAFENALSSPYQIGDANLDGVVDGVDFIAWNNNKFTASLLWAAGNFNGDAVIDGQDFILWNGNKFTSSDDARAVPEPGAASLLLILLLGLHPRHPV